jgi:hypothetical protein
MFPTGDMPGFIPMHQPRWVSTPQVHTTGESSEARAWAAQSSDSDDMPPPVPPRHSVSRWEDMSRCLGRLEIYTGNIQNTLNTHVQNTTHWHEEQQQKMAQINERLQQQHKQHTTFWRHMGFYPRP